MTEPSPINDVADAVRAGSPRRVDVSFYVRYGHELQNLADRLIALDRAEVRRELVVTVGDGVAHRLGKLRAQLDDLDDQVASGSRSPVDRARHRSRS